MELCTYDIISWRKSSLSYCGACSCAAVFLFHALFLTFSLLFILFIKGLLELLYTLGR